MINSETLKTTLWKIFLLVLPISSFTLISRLFRGTSVAPLAVIPMLLLLIGWWLPALVKNGFRLPYQVKPLLLFFLAGTFSTLFIIYRDVPTFQSANLYQQVFEVFLTFGMGLGFYFITVYMVKDTGKLQETLYWVSIAGIILMAFSWFQVITWILLKHYPVWMYKIQAVISSNGMLFPRRATGLAFEPSWLAHELNMIFIPIWLGLSLRGQSVFKSRLFNRVQVEKVLFAFSVITLFISFSRIGWITLFILAAYIAFRFLNQWIKKLSDQKYQSGSPKAKIFWFRFGAWCGLVVGLAAVLLVAGLILSKIDPRMRELFELKKLLDAGFMRWASKLVFLERVMYWISAYRVFELFPFLGAGFGVPGFFFQTTVPVYGSQLLDINDFMLKPFFLPNAKNYWVRILSETGIIGFAFFASWVVTHWRNAAEIEKHSDNELLSAMGLTGKMMVIAMIIEGFSIDSFGLPYIWVALGLITATWLIDRQLKAKPERLART